jgi:DNA mismatch endonuclease (patch repair protein)
MMAGIRGKDTKPELLVRRGLHGKGFRFRLHVRELPGSPDLVLPKFRAVIFVHGCFWHGHDCPLFKWPATREEFWRKKITRNREVDAQALSLLSAEGWRSATIWECALRGRGKIPLEEVLAHCSDWLLSETGGLEIRGKPT